MGRRLGHRRRGGRRELRRAAASWTGRLSTFGRIGYLGRMSRNLDSRRLRRLATCLVLGGLLGPVPALAQTVLPFAGFAPLPAFVWGPPRGGETDRWSGSYAAVSTGYAFSSSKQFGSYGGPTIGLEGGRMWQEGRFVYGIVGGVDFLVPGAGANGLGVGGFGYSRDLAGAVQVQVGTLLTDNVLLYGKAGAWAVHERLRFGGNAAAPLDSREDVAVRPDARVGVEWAITDRLSVAVEAGVVGNRLH